MFVSEMSVSEKIVDFVDNLNYSQIPSDVIQKTKLHFLDTLGICLASSEFDFGSIVLKVAEGLGSGAESTAIGFGKKLPVASAALVNGTLAHGLDFDDTHIGAIVHASAPVAAAALAVGEAEKADGRKLLTALAAGLEIVTRMGLIAGGAFHDRGFHPTAICGTFAASLVTGKIMGYTRESMVSAFGLCGSMAAGLLQIRESWLKRMHPGWAAHAGIIASRLGHYGFIGPKDILEGSMGLYKSHLGDLPIKWSLLLDDLGMRWEISNIAIKPYPCCHFTHAFIDCARFFKANMKVNPKDIEQIVCKIPERVVPVVFEPIEAKRRPKLAYDAQFSVPYLVGCMLVKGEVNLDTVYRQDYDDPEVLDLADKTTWLPDPDSDYPKHFTGEMKIVLKDGRTLERRENTNRGGPENPMTGEEIEEKFLNNAVRLIGSKEADNIVKQVRRLEDMQDICGLIGDLVVR